MSYDIMKEMKIKGWSKMTIKTKRDIEELWSSFCDFAQYDEKGAKHYLVFSDKERSGDWTLMVYRDGLITAHGRGIDYCDEGERVLKREEASKFVWKNRKAINAVIREKRKVTTS